MAKMNITEGICFYCSESYSSPAMTRHLESCGKRKNFYLEIDKKSKLQSNNIVFLLKIYSKYYQDIETVYQLSFCLSLLIPFFVIR